VIAFAVAAAAVLTVAGPAALLAAVLWPSYTGRHQ
jgi:hypothetical protein